MKKQEKLQQERKELQDQVATLKASVDVKPEYGLGKGDPAITQQQLDRVLLEQLEGRIAEIENALARLEEGTYGICELCGKPIDPNRLAVLPDTKICIECAREQ